MSDYRTILTPFYSKIAHDVLDSVLGQLSDGWGENNSGNDKWWRFARVETLPNGNVVLKISNEFSKNDGYRRWTSNGFKTMNDAEVIEKFAKWIKKTIQMELRDNDIKNGWKRDNVKTTTFYLNRDTDINVAQVYCIYETLLNRDISGKYTVGVYNSVFGSKKSDEETKLEEDRRAREEAARLEYASKRQEITDWEKAEILRIKKMSEEKLQALYKEYISNTSNAA